MSHDQTFEASNKGSVHRQQLEATLAADAGAQPHPLLRLQSQLGNAHVARMVVQRAAEEDEEGAGTVQAKHDARLAQRAAADQEEEEEDKEQAVQAKHDQTAQRAAADEDESLVQTKREVVGMEGGPVGPETVSAIQAKRGGGSPLDEGTRSSMEQFFGTSFGDVRVHADAESDALNRNLTARAFTTGSDIFLRGDASPSDNRLLVHELTHVVQQRSRSTSGATHVGAAGDADEQHADAVAEQASLAPSQSPASASTAQRELDAAEDG